MTEHLVVLKWEKTACFHSDIEIRSTKSALMQVIRASSGVPSKPIQTALILVGRTCGDTVIQSAGKSNQQIGLWHEQQQPQQSELPQPLGGR